MVALVPNAKQQFLDASGVPLALGTVTFYIPGTTTPKDTWQDNQQAAKNANPLPLDAAGRALIFGVGDYRQIVKDSNGVTIWDQVTSAPPSVPDVTGVTATAVAAAATATTQAGISATQATLATKQAGAAAISAVTINSYPNSAATNVPKGAISFSFTAGTGGTNSINNLATFTGGTLTNNPVILYDVVGAVVTNVRMTFGGLYIGSATPTMPTVVLANGGTGTITLASGLLFAVGQGYWVQAADGLSLTRYSNVAGVATVDNTVGPLGTPAAINASAAAAAASAATAGSAATTAVSAVVAPINDYLTVLAKRFDGYGPGSFVAGQAGWNRTARARLTSYFIDRRIGDDTLFDGTQPYKAKATGTTSFASLKATASALLFRNGQQHIFRGVSNPANGQFPQFGNDGGAIVPFCLGNFGSGATAPPLIETRHFISETWTNISGDVWETTIPIETITFGATGVIPNITTPRPTVWQKSDTDSVSIGTRLQWVTGGASASDNNTALAALSGVGVTVRAPTGSGFETAGEVRSTGAVLSSVVVRVKQPAGVNPNTTRDLLIVDRQASAVFQGGWHGSFTILPGMGKDTASFVASPMVAFGAGKEIPWGEEVAIYGGGHSGVGCFNTTGKYSGIGVPTEGEAGFAKGRTSGWAVHRFNPGVDLRDVWLYNQSIYAANSQVGMSMHGAGTAGEGYRGWIIPDDITIVNCDNGISPDLLVESLLHYGRLDITNTGNVVNCFTTPMIRVASKGGQFVSDNSQTSLAKFSPVAGYTIDIGSDNLAEPFWLDASAINTGSPDFNAATLIASSDNGSYGSAMNIVILRNVREKYGKTAAAANKSFRFNKGDYFVNSNKVWLDLRAGTSLQNMMVGNANVTDLTTIPAWLPLRLSWGAGVQWGIGNHTFAEIQAAYSTLGRTCTIASGAIAVNIAGDVIDVKA
jgi:hypothetical protein